jgi:hypothetical protein
MVPAGLDQHANPQPRGMATMKKIICLLALLVAALAIASPHARAQNKFVDQPDPGCSRNVPSPFTCPPMTPFRKLPASTVDNLVKPEHKDTRVKILTYHVVAGRISAI